jgi:hypothetical protein
MARLKRVLFRVGNAGATTESLNHLVTLACESSNVA